MVLWGFGNVKTDDGDNKFTFSDEAISGFGPSTSLASEITVREPEWVKQVDGGYDGRWCQEGLYTSKLKLSEKIVPTFEFKQEQHCSIQVKVGLCILTVPL